jgi:ABC-type multidrug transport system fused ATPase/permease subunit
VIVANITFAAAFVIAILGHWQLALVVIGVGLIPAVAAQVVRRWSSRGKGSARDE